MLDFGPPRDAYLTFTPKMAGEWLEAKTYERQRLIHPRHVTFLTAVREHEEFNPYSPIEVCVLPDGQEIITNGHHRLTSIAAGSTDQVVSVKFVSVPDMNAVRRLYATHDNGGRTRTVADIATAYGTDETLDLARNQIINVGAAALLVHQKFPPHRCGLDYETKSPSFRNQLLTIYGPFAAQFFADIKDAPRLNISRLSKQGVLAVAIATYMAPLSLAKAKAFWSGLAFDDGLRASDPRKALLNWLSLPKRGHPDTAEIVANVAQAWNAAFEGAPLAKCNARKKSDIVILGTGFGTKSATSAAAGKVRRRAKAANAGAVMSAAPP